MARVLCTLPNASDSINGIAFEDHPSGKLSAEISTEDAAQFAGINGYELLNEPTPDELDALAAEQAQAAADELARLRARGQELGIPSAIQMGAKRLTSEIAAKEKAIADAAASAS